MPEPMYRRIAEELHRRIESGDLAPGKQLPTELELREEFEASRNTIRDAVKLLISLGLVQTRPGQGTFVAQRINPFVTVLTADPETGLGGGEEVTYLSQVQEQRRNATISAPRVESQVASRMIAARLGVGEGTPLVSRHQRRFIDETPWSLQTSFYPMQFVMDGASKLLLAEDITEGSVRYLESALGLKQMGYRDWITVRAPDTQETGFFGIEADGRVPVYEIFRTAFDQNKEPMRLTVTVFPADRNQFILDVGEVPAIQQG